MNLSQKEHDREEVRSLESRLVDIEDHSRQVAPSAAGREYRAKLRRDIEILQKHLSVVKTR